MTQGPPGLRVSELRVGEIRIGTAMRLQSDSFVFYGGSADDRRPENPAE